MTRRDLTRERLAALMTEIARTAPASGRFRVYFVGGSTAVLAGWRATSIDADLHAEDDAVFRDVQGIKERLDVNVEFARPEHFVPPLPGSNERHLFIEQIGPVSYFHYDPYAQAFSKIVRGFDRDLHDARSFIRAGWVDPHRLRALVEDVPAAIYARYPQLSRQAVVDAVRTFVESAA